MKPKNGKRVYHHKPYHCMCNPNFSWGDGENENHKDPRNEWTRTSYFLLEGTCPNCKCRMEKQLEWDEVIPRNGKGSWQK